MFKNLKLNRKRALNKSARLLPHRWIPLSFFCIPLSSPLSPLPSPALSPLEDDFSVSITPCLISTTHTTHARTAQSQASSHSPFLLPNPPPSCLPAPASDLRVKYCDESGSVRQLLTHCFLAASL